MSVRLFGHYVSFPLLILMLIEGAIHVGSVHLAATLRFDSEFQVLTQFFFSHTGSQVLLFPRAVLYAVVLMGVMTAFGLYGTALTRNDSDYRARFLVSFPTSALALVVLFYVVPESFLGRGVMAFSLLFSLILTSLAREVFARVVGIDALKQRVLVLGTGSRAMEVEDLLDRLGTRASFNLVGYLPTGSENPQVDPSRILAGDCASIRSIVSEHRIDEIVVGVRDRRNGQLPMTQLLDCKLDGVSVVDLPTFFEREIGYVQLSSLNPSWIVFSEGFYRGEVRRLLKRGFDICVSAVMLVAALPLMLAAVVSIRLESRGPILYRQQRIGENGRIFEVLKFRSMRTDAEKDGKAQWAKKNDNRVTRVGKFLRVSRIDELPQIINVLKGEMSFVGPRPERPVFVQELTEKLPYYASRHSVKPGITGWAQIRYPYGASIDDAAKKLQFDLYYVKNQSLFLDMVILFQTAQVVLFGQGAR